MASNKPFSISLKSSAKSTVAPKRKKRPISALAEASESEEEGPQETCALVIGDQDETKAVPPLVIGGQKNKDWRDSSRNLLPAEERARRAGAVQPEEEEQQRTWGLVVKKRKKEESLDVQVEDEPFEVEKKPKTADEEALAALLGDKKEDSGLVIPGVAASDDRFAPRITEGDMFRADVESRPDAASLDDYSVVPVEDFGRALMRGMGWKEGMEVGRMKNVAIKDKTKKEERRAARLGIGAKELPSELAEPGAWGKGAKRGGKTLTTFTPLRMKNKVTGEIMTEGEYKARKDNQKLILDDDRQDKKEKGSTSEHRSHKDRDHDRDKSHRYQDSDRESKPRRDGHRERDRDYERRDRRHRDDVDRHRHKERREDRDRGRDGRDRRNERKQRDDDHSNQQYRR